MQTDDSLRVPGDVVSKSGRYLCVGCLSVVELNEDEVVPRCSCCGVDARYMVLYGNGIMSQPGGVRGLPSSCRWR